MTEGKDPATPPQDTGVPDGAESDPAALNSAEDLDEDRLDVDPLEEGVEPPEHWSEADAHGTTPFEQQQGESLDERLREERPDVSEPAVPDRPIAATPAPELDESIDYVREDVEPVPPDDELAEPGSRRTERSQNADLAGGSVADGIRTPRSDEE
ncbi:hypothetical protein B0I33_106309 [Prauserella shujinwangii]|uniref:DUF5709 domain-containing protein n=1 Tax=Prauserella shujinwangii TaxID=1453103 RepID=A0A2T0LTZ2_9PSEU|nr:hypothetical protein [Prauserella shujinwangii]PRX47208.1 hypothetical protein B0I33_106309 [Prauserella shujinwangii]